MIPEIISGVSILIGFISRIALNLKTCSPKAGIFFSLIPNCDKEGNLNKDISSLISFEIFSAAEDGE
jgi:hypothetical protein